MNTRILLIEDRWYRTQREAMALIEAERKAREEKTERLRLMRMAKEALKPATTHRNKRHMKTKKPAATSNMRTAGKDARPHE